MFSAVCCGVWLELSNQKPIRGVVCILLNTNSMYTERYKEWEGFRRSWHCRKIQKFRFSHNAYLWSLVRNSVVLAVYLLFSVACFLTVHEHRAAGFQQELHHMTAQTRTGTGPPCLYIPETQPKNESAGCSRRRSGRKGRWRYRCPNSKISGDWTVRECPGRRSRGG